MGRETVKKVVGMSVGRQINIQVGRWNDGWIEMTDNNKTSIYGLHFH